MPALNDLATRTYEGDRTYADAVWFIHVYVIEPHPMSPAPSPYSGRVWELAYSTIGQPRDYADRVADATATEAFLEGEQLLLVDDLAHDGRTNPVWCTYGPAPNAAFLIRRNGTLDTVQTWLDVPDMKDAIDRLLAAAR